MLYLSLSVSPLAPVCGLKGTAIIDGPGKSVPVPLLPLSYPHHRHHSWPTSQCAHGIVTSRVSPLTLAHTIVCRFRCVFHGILITVGPSHSMPLPLGPLWNRHHRWPTPQWAAASMAFKVHHHRPATLCAAQGILINAGPAPVCRCYRGHQISRSPQAHVAVCRCHCGLLGIFKTACSRHCMSLPLWSPR